MKLNDFIEGLTILQDYYNDPNGYHIGAEHDQFFIYNTDLPLSEEHVTRMFALGWFQPDAKIVNGERVNDYDPDDGWSTFV